MLLDKTGDIWSSKWAVGLLGDPDDFFLIAKLDSTNVNLPCCQKWIQALKAFFLLNVLLF